MEFGDSRLPQRFWDKVYPEPNTSCWLWGAATHKSGYGQFGHRPVDHPRKITEHSHRVVYRALVGAIPKDYHVDHLCRQRCCVNPAHLEAVTALENHRRGLHNQNTAKTHCNQGHPLSGDNLYAYTTKTGDINRHCKICRNRLTTAYYANGMTEAQKEKSRIRGRTYRARLRLAAATSPADRDRIRHRLAEQERRAA